MTATVEHGAQVALSSRCMITLEFFVDEMWSDAQIAEHALLHMLASVPEIVAMARGRR